MNRALPPLLAGASLLLLLLCLSAIALVRMQRRHDQFAARVAQFANPYLRAAAPHTRERAHGRANPPWVTLLYRMARGLGFDPARQEHYPIQWWIVLPAMLLTARVGVALIQSLIGDLALALVPLLWGFGVRSFYRWCDARRLNALYLQFPDALAMMVRAVRVGTPIAEGIRSVAHDSPQPTGEVFRRVADEVAIGVTLVEALRELATRNPLPEYRFFATALALQSQTGGGVSETLENLADVIRKRVALRGRAVAMASEARTSIFILASLPVISGLGLALFKPDYIGALFSSPEGQRIFATALISLALGIASMQGLIRKSLA
jgi:tight adherence protein B